MARRFQLRDDVYALVDVVFVLFFVAMGMTGMIAHQTWEQLGMSLASCLFGLAFFHLVLTVEERTST